MTAFLAFTYEHRLTILAGVSLLILTGLFLPVGDEPVDGTEVRSLDVHRDAHQRGATGAPHHRKATISKLRTIQRRGAP